MTKSCLQSSRLRSRPSRHCATIARSGGRGFFPRLSGEVLAGQSRPGLDWERSTPAELARRSLYVYVRRTMPVPVLEAFDYSNTASPLSERGLTTVAPQALILLNDEFMQTQAAAFALRLAQESGPSPQQRLRRGFQLAVGREPTRRETALALAFLAQQEKAFASVRSRLTFRPEVPPSLSVDYMGRLQAADFLVGPADGWTYHRGRWSGAYEGIRAVDRARGPFALCRHESFADGTVEAKLVLHQASESAGFLFRAQADGDELRGYEVLLDPRRGRVALRRHAKEAAFLAESLFALQTGQLLSVRVQASGPRLRVWLNGGARPLLDVTDPEPLTAAGRVGLKAWGAALSLDDLVLRVGDRTVRPGDAWPLPAARDRALGALCLMLLNLNEVVYVD